MPEFLSVSKFLVYISKGYFLKILRCLTKQELIEIFSDMIGTKRNWGLMSKEAIITDILFKELQNEILLSSKLKLCTGASKCISSYEKVKAKKRNKNLVNL